MATDAQGEAAEGFSLTRLRAALRESFAQHGAVYIVIFLVLLHFTIYNGCIEPARKARLGAEARQNLHLLQLALERFSVDSPGASYPESTSLLIQQGYLSELPNNPFTGAPMQEYHPGEIPPPGDFVYAPVRDEQGDVVGYELAIGSQRAAELAQRYADSDEGAAGQP
jgi:hypothetical protein